MEREKFIIEFTTYTTEGKIKVNDRFNNAFTIYKSYIKPQTQYVVLYLVNDNGNDHKLFEFSQL